MTEQEEWALRELIRRLIPYRNEYPGARLLLRQLIAKLKGKAR